MPGPNKSEHEAKKLAEAVRVLARHEGARSDGLSSDRRSRIFHAVTEEHPVPGPSSRLFTPWRSMALAGVVPALLVAAVVGWIGLRGEGPRHEILQPTGVEVVKTGDQVVFNIANGGTEHFVSTSERPDRFDGSTRAKVVDGTYVDRLDRGAELIFYRID